MTLIATFCPERPIIISDVLLSYLGLPKVRLTPTGVEIKRREGLKKNQPHSFCQKTILLCEDKVAFTGLGDLSTLKMLATDLSGEIRNGMTCDKLTSWLKKKEPISGRRASVIVSWFDQDEYVVAALGKGIHARPFGDKEKVIYGGSGAKWLERNLIKKFASIEKVGVFAEHEIVRSLAIAQTGLNFVQERIMGVRDDFGGGFQTTFFDGNRFVTVSDIAYLTLLVEHDASGPLNMELSSPIVMQRWYSGRLSFELWGFENRTFERSEGDFLVQGVNQFHESVMPPLLHFPPPQPVIQNLSTCEYVNVNVLHHQAGSLVGLGSFQMTGDPKLNPLRLQGERNESFEVKLTDELFNTWKSRFTPFSPNHNFNQPMSDH